MPRPSHVRDAVLSQLASGSRHLWTVEEMRAELGARGVSADFSSVFRGLLWCESEKLVERVDLGDGRARFEASGSHHEHARCERCGTITEVPGCLLEDVSGQLRAATGFSVTGHRLVITGLCPACQ